MDSKTRLLRTEIKGYDLLEELALDFVWSWDQNHSADKVWGELDPDLWNLLRNPWVILQTVSVNKLKSKLADPQFCQMVKGLIERNQREMSVPAWFQEKYSKSALKCIAYFSMEFMLEESLPIYSGGLGNVAGDQLKAASDLGVPVVGIGLLYQQGYFRQMINVDGSQQALYPYNDPGQLPIIPLRKEDGEWLRLEIALPGWSVWVRAWEVKVGRAKLYLLDTNDAMNFPFHRGITSELYGGDSELRLKQEIILGIGGYRLLQALGINAEVCHLNEGHAAFAVLERARSFMMEHKVSFDVALSATRMGNLFTTHTAVPAGFDRFSPQLIDQYLGKYAQEKLGISVQELLSLGRLNAADSVEYFNMAYLAARGSGAINGVSMLHGKVSRYLFQILFPRWPKHEIPVGSVTNGVHMPSWTSVGAGELWRTHCGEDSWCGEMPAMEENLRKVPDEKLWEMRNQVRKNMIEYARARLSSMWAARGMAPQDVERAKKLFDPNVLTMGFARRFATYKRPNMLLHDKERLLRILTNTKAPVQLILAGKAHPADQPGQAMIKEWIQFIWRPEVRDHVIFLSDYDILVTENLVHGVDLWINTPRRPWEACGTSGMKVLVNGGLNLSELDGWWAEAYAPEVGWAIGDGKEHGDDPSWDAAEANALYDLLEKEIIPEFYNRNAQGIPAKWIGRMRESMARLTPRFSADRCVREYTEKHYIPAAEQYLKRASDHGADAKKLVNWRNDLQKKWPSIRLGEMKTEKKGNTYDFQVQVFLGDLDPNAIKVQIFADGSDEHISQDMTRSGGDKGNYTYKGSVEAKRPLEDFTLRIVPFFPDARVPLEASQILWQH